jgi:hypothetical protein
MIAPAKDRVTNWATAALSVIAFALALATRADPDLWGHLRFGLDLLRDRRLTSIDPYSFTQDKPWTNHEWLSELQLAWAYRAGGTTGLLILKATLLWIAFALVWRALREAALRVRVGTIVVTMMGTIHVTSSARPQLWTFLGIALLCVALTNARASVRWWLPAMFVVWANCHGGWIVGIAVLGAWAVTEVWQAPAHWRYWMGLTVTCVAATLVNPYGLGLWTFMASTVRMTRAIDEWQTLWQTPILNWVPWALAVAATLWMWRRNVPRRLSVALTLTVLSYASLRVMRIESLYIVAAAILLAPALAERWPRKPGPAVVPASVIRALAVALLIAATSGSVLVARWATSCVPITGGWAPDLGAMAALRHASPGRIVTPFNWGEYALWHLSPRLRVSMDGRRETTYSEARLMESDGILSGEPEGFAVLEQWHAEYVWVPATSRATIDWLRVHGYRIDIETAQSSVAVRGDLPRLVAYVEETARPCFPG